MCWQDQWILDYNSLPPGRLKVIGLDAKGSKVTDMGLGRKFVRILLFQSRVTASFFLSMLSPPQNTLSIGRTVASELGGPSCFGYRADAVAYAVVCRYCAAEIAQSAKIERLSIRGR